MLELIIAILLGLACPSNNHTNSTNDDGTTVVVPDNPGGDTGGETGHTPIKN